MLARLLQALFFALIVRPVCVVLLGINVRGREKLPQSGPAIIVANHNSHLDTVVMMHLFPLRLLRRLRPVGAKDYFFRGPVSSWFFKSVANIIPLERNRVSPSEDPLAGAIAALSDGDILFVFPEGSRGEPEQMQEFKSGVAHMVKRMPDTKVVPVFMHGLGKALPRGEALLVPFFCDVFIGEPISWPGDKHAFMTDLKEQMNRLSAEGDFRPWD